MSVQIPECQHCGACCAHSDEYVPVREADAHRLDPWLYTPATPDGQWDTVPMPPFVMKMIGTAKRCVALEGQIGQQVSCSIYTHRPDVCRDLVRGCAECAYMVGYHRLGRPW